MRLTKYVLPYACLTAVVVILTITENNLLFRLQEQNLFLHTPLFFEQQMVKAGGLLTWAGCYLTQFFCYPMLGAGLLCLLWAFLMWLLKRTLRLKDEWLALVPVACLLLTIVTLGYWVFYLKLSGAAFDATLGTIIAVLLVCIYRALPNRSLLQSAFIVLSTCVSYPLFGFYGLWATAMMALLAGRKAWIAVLSVVIVPLVCYYTLYHETHIVNIYWAALPVYCYQGTRCAGYYLPYCCLVLSICLMVRVPSCWKWAQGVVLAATAVCVVAFWNKDHNFHQELKMYRSLEQCDWQQVLQAARKTKGEPTRAICMMQNLALFRLGRPAEEMLTYPNGARQPEAPFSVRMVHTYGKLLYLQYGVPNYCHRWCVEDAVERGWTVSELKLMVKCALLNGEPVLAQRLLNLLKKTDFQRSWTRHYELYLQKPHLISQDRELRPILPLLRSDNFLTADQTQMELFLIEQLLSTPGTTHEQQELAQRTAFYYQHNRKKLVEQ